MSESAEVAQNTGSFRRTGIASWLTPRRAFWFGLALTVGGVYGSTFLINGTMSLGGQDLASSWPIWSLNYLLGLAVPVGAGFLVASVVARALSALRPSPVSPPEDSDEQRVPPRLSSRVAVLVGVSLIVIALVDQSVRLINFLPTQPGVERDVLWLLYPLLGLLGPLGAALIPGAWLLARIERSRGVGDNNGAHAQP